MGDRLFSFSPDFTLDSKKRQKTATPSSFLDTAQGVGNSSGFLLPNDRARNYVIGQPMSMRFSDFFWPRAWVIPMADFVVASGTIGVCMSATMRVCVTTTEPSAVRRFSEDNRQIRCSAPPAQPPIPVPRRARNDASSGFCRGTPPAGIRSLVP